MAYLAFDFAPATTAPTAAPRHDVEVAFTQREWLVIRLARKDRGGNPHRFSRFARFFDLLFGVRPANPLADPKLEALRIAATSLWRTRSYASEAHIDELLSRGYSFGQIALLSSWIADRVAAYR